MSSNFQVYAISFFLALLGFLIVTYKVLVLDIPLTPHVKKSLFTISAEITFKGDEKPAKLSMALPQSMENIPIISTENESNTFGFTTSTTREGKRAEWAKRKVVGKKKIFYKITLAPKQNHFAYIDPQKNLSPFIPTFEEKKEDPFILWDELDRNAALHLISWVKSHSADALSFTAQLIAQMNKPNPMTSVDTLLKMKNQNKISLITTLLEYGNIPYRKIRGISLEDGQKKRRLTPMLEVWSSKNRWEVFDYTKGHTILPANFFVWQRGKDPLLKTKGIKKPTLRFSVTETQVPVSATIKKSSLTSQSNLLNFSLFTLPSSQQNAFKQILLVPMGVLVVVVLRILIGIRTMGTFMPVLLALTFIQTTLLSGLVMFLVITFSGLFIRFYLSKLRLLLVARISAVIIVVITIMSLMSIFSYKLGISQVLTVTFFPMIILSWTIERMSILWEEEGRHEVLVQGGGALLVAVLAYFAMNNEWVAYLFFNFPELLLVLLAIIILIGRYTGYRLTELLRFAPLGRH